MTILLAIATATSQVGVALAGEDGPIASTQVRQGRRHGELLAPAIESLTGMAGISMRNITRIAVDVGPGLFTGLRVGVATAKALASALEVPIVGCSSLELIAYPHGGTTAAIVDAKRGEVFWAIYDNGKQITTPEVASPKDVAEAIANEHPCDRVAGDGARRYAEIVAAHTEIAGPTYDHPSAANLAEIALNRPSVPLTEIAPLYLRGADVRIGWEQREPQGG